VVVVASVLTRFLYSIFYLEIITSPWGLSEAGTNRGLGFYFLVAICFTL
jgi:hypothetical protein